LNTQPTPKEAKMREIRTAHWNIVSEWVVSIAGEDVAVVELRDREVTKFREQLNDRTAKLRLRVMP
jgi:hypothetical protein